MRHFLLSALVLLAAVAPSAVEAAPVYIIRHLERAPGDNKDPPLTERGALRAGQLMDVLAQARIKAVFATATKRAQETGAPLARRLGMGVTTYNPRDMDALVAAVKAADGPVLIVGHSNTVADLVARFGDRRRISVRVEPIVEP